MGKGYSFKCKNCGQEYGVGFGAGYFYSATYRKKIDEIRSGKLSEQRKELLEKTPYAAISAENVLYVCGDCGNWKLDTDYTLYAPNDPESIAKERFGEKTVEELGYVPYVTSWDLRESYHAIKRYYCSCDKCGKRMHKVPENRLKSLRCPKCGTLNEPES